jgi:hypothetical protein
MRGGDCIMTDTYPRQEETLLSNTSQDKRRLECLANMFRNAMVGCRQFRQLLASIAASDAIQARDGPHGSISNMPLFNYIF